MARQWEVGAAARWRKLPPRNSVRAAVGAVASLARVAAILFVGATVALAASPPPATSSKAAREETLRLIPIDKLAPDVKDKVRSTLTGASIYRRMPVQVIDCDPDLYYFLVQHPEVIVNIWEVMKISNVALHRTGPDTFRASDGMGTLCNVKYCYSDHETQIIYAEGSYDGPLFARPVQAKCVLVLKSGYLQETNGRYFVTSRMDAFVEIENVGVEILAKTLQLLVNRSADYNFVETAAFVGTMSKAAEMNPVGMHRLAGKLNNCEPDVRERLKEISLAVGKRGQERDASRPASAQPAAKQASVRPSAPATSSRKRW